MTRIAYQELEQFGNRMAAAGRISWHGVRNGAKVYRRYDPIEVFDELKHKHGVEVPDFAPKK